MSYAIGSLRVDVNCSLDANDTSSALPSCNHVAHLVGSSVQLILNSKQLTQLCKETKTACSHFRVSIADVNNCVEYETGSTSYSSGVKKEEVVAPPPKKHFAIVEDSDNYTEQSVGELEIEENCNSHGVYRAHLKNSTALIVLTSEQVSKLKKENDVDDDVRRQQTKPTMSKTVEYGAGSSKIEIDDDYVLCAPVMYRAITDGKIFHMNIPAIKDWFKKNNLPLPERFSDEWHSRGMDVPMKIEMK